MSRILLLVLFLIWMAGPPGASPHELWPGLAVFFSFYVMLVVLLGLWSRVLARRVAADNFGRSIRRFNFVMWAARVMVPVWFMLGVWVLGWGALVAFMVEGMYRSVVGMLIGTLPAFATWMGLWWSQYPAERALREQNLLVELDNDLPIYRPPPFRSYFFSNFRLQVLFTLLPVAMIVLIHDMSVWGLQHLNGHAMLAEPSQSIEMTSLFLGAATVFIFAPALLRRVLSTTPMPDSPLRQKLDLICKRAGVRYSQILVWNTNNHVGNAAVMGVLPWLRYVLLSDVLLERMSNDEIEAVFAHEIGHVVHRHMSWYAVFFVVLMFFAMSAEKFVNSDMRFLATASAAVGGAIVAGGMAGIMLLFGALSRRCERQADVYAARTMEMLKSEEPVVTVVETFFAPHQLAAVGTEPPPAPPRGARETHVGHRGARIFAGALLRVAAINNISIAPVSKAAPGFWNHLAHYADGFVELANNWLHGSIASRMQYVQTLSTDPQKTSHFDRTMFWMYCGILLALFTSVILSVMSGAFVSTN